jgi:hypothetical protein
LKVLASGGQGTVCMFEKVDTKERCAVKFDPNDNGDSSVLKECLFLRKVNKLDDRKPLTCFPKYYDHGKQDGRRYLII